MTKKKISASAFESLTGIKAESESAASLNWALTLPEGENEAKGYRSWCKKVSLGKDKRGQELFSIVVS